MIINKPINVSWMITNRCNYHCQFCFGSFEEEELTLEQAKIVTDNLHKAGLRKISWAGGEPLLWPDIMELISYTKSLNIITMLISNGELITDEILSQLEQNLDWLNLPLEGSNSNINELMTRKTGHYDRTIRLFEKLKNSSIKLKINTVAAAINIDDIVNMVPIIKEYNIKRWKIFQFYPVRGRAIENKKKFLLDKGKFENVRKKVTDMLRDVDCQVVFEDNNELGDSYFSITPSGLVYVSKGNEDIIIGDLKTQSVESIWQNPALDKNKYNKRTSWLLKPSE